MEDDLKQPFICNLKTLKQASINLHQNPNPNPNSPAVKPLLDLTIPNDPQLITLSTHLTHLKTLITRHPQPGFTSFFTRRVNSLELSRLAHSIESEIDHWIDRELILTLITTIRKTRPDSKTRPGSETETRPGSETRPGLGTRVLVELMERFEDRIAGGFDRELQDVILRSGVFGEVESVLCGLEYPKRVREEAGFAITGLVKFNKDVFVGQVLISETVRALISLGSVRSIRALTMLIRLIKSPIIDIMEFNGEIASVIELLMCEDVLIRAMALDCVLEIGYFGRKDAIDAMLKHDLIKKLVELQRCNNNNNNSNSDSDSDSNSDNNSNDAERHWFSSCVARFAVQFEVGEGLRQREKRALKQEVLTRVREAHVSDAEAATIIAEVLWGASA